jgi:hypothetical protein
VTAIDFDGVWTDGVLAVIAAFAAAASTARTDAPGLAAAGGFVSIGLAGVLGVVAWAVDPAPDALPERLHHLGSVAAGDLGMPLVGAALAVAVLRPPRPGAILGGLAAFLAVAGLAIGDVELWRTAVGAVAMLAAFVSAMALSTTHPKSAAAAGIGACVITAVGLALGTGPDPLAGISRTGWFHLGIGLGIALLAAGVVAPYDAGRDPRGTIPA